MINENKIMLYGDTARDAMAEGMKKVYDAVRVTMGPAGRNVMIENEIMKPMATKDGVTVAKFIKLSDKKQDMGAQLIKSVSSQTAEQAGDSTTNSTVLAYTMMKNGLDALKENKDLNLIDFKRGMDYATDLIVQELKEQSKECKTREDIFNIAMISSNGDREMSELVTEAVYKTKIEHEDGSIAIETSTTFESGVEFSEAVVVNSGYGQYYQFVNRDTDFTHVNDDVRVLIFDGSMGQVTQSIKNILKECHVNDEALLIIANEFSPNFVQNIVQNIRLNNLKCVLVESPEFGAFQKQVLRDIAVATSTQVIGGEGSSNAHLATVKRDDLGVCRNIVVHSDKTYIKVGLNEDYVAKMNPNKSDDEVKTMYNDLNGLIKQEIKDYCTGLENGIKDSRNEYERIKIKNRINNLSSIKATIHLYGMSDVEVKEKEHRADDAVFATSSAIEEGYVVGGGLTLAKLQPKLNSIISKLDGEHSKSFIMGMKNIANSITKPLEQIMENAYRYPSYMKGDIDPAFEMVEIDLNDKSNKGFDARNLCLVDDMIKEGIIDPTKVIRCALQNANSVSSITLTTECLIFSDHYYTEELSSKENHNLMYHDGEG